MKTKLFETDNNYATLILRVVLGAIVFAHGYPKLGSGFAPFMAFMTDTLHMPAVLGWLTVLFETLGCALLVVGVATRINAALLFALFVGIIASVHWSEGFFMNWFGQLEKGREGYEYHLLILAVCAALVVQGGGALSVDRLIISRKR
jgi:putative oxidoreductase